MRELDEKISKELAEKLSKNFSYENLEEFLIRKNPNFIIHRERLYSNEEELNKIFPIEEVYKFAEVNLKDGLHFVVFVIKTNEPLTERKSKKKQYEVAKNLLKTFFLNTGLFIFHDKEGNFRFSLVYRIFQGTKQEFSYYKRFTFYVSPNLTNKTFIFQIGACDFTSFEKIKDAFSIEPVTKQFYDEIQTWYYWAMDKVKFPDDYKYSENPEKDREIRNATNLIRLITRIIFIWFLKEKGLIPEILFKDEPSEEKEKTLKEIVKDFGKGNNYYNAILQNLFFATLNSKIDQRGWAKNEGFQKNKSNYGVKTLFRYEDKFLINEDEVLELFKDIPFLNGGLFDCLDKEDETGKVIYIDGFSRNPEKQAIIPDYLFFQKEERKVDLSQYGLGENKRVRGLIHILKSYNFTTDEATPIDQEIALDPELLGKVFENLLASYNPETATTARKATGSYYTPREIVDYMVEESLKEYLKTKLPDIDEYKIDLLLSYSDEIPDLSDEEKQKIISAIDEVQILDPACGSGAFPMGILHKLVYILQKIDPDNKLWYEHQYQKSVKASEEVFKEKDKLEREEMLKEINEAFDESINYPDYARKLYLIENCIYGVDIQPIAIQISKLRFFISLVLDQKVDRTKENFGIRPLPNLETKFVSANTLIGLERPKQLIIRDPEIENKERELKELRHRYFTAKTRTQKQRLQEKDRKIRQEIAQLLINNDWNETTAYKIANFDIFDQNASADWFDPEWMFGVTDGFDIVIGNPPYGAKYEQKHKIYFLNNYETAKTVKGKYKGSLDTYTLFIEKGFDLLKINGNLIYIVPISITSSNSVENLHSLLEKNCKIIKVSSFAVRPQPIFQNSVVDVSIIYFIKTLTPAEKILCTKIYRKSKDNSISDILTNLIFIDIKEFKLKGRYPKISYQIEKNILQKIFDKDNTPIENLLRSYGKPIYYRTSGGRYFKIVTNYPTGSTKEKALYFDNNIADVIGAILSSNLFFWFYQIYSNNHDLKLYEISSFCIPYKKIIENTKLITKIEEIYNEYLYDIEKNAIIKITTQYKNINKFKEYKIRKSKHIIDKIDDLICPLYGMTKEEIEFIKDYELEFRLSDENSIDEEEI